MLKKLTLTLAVTAVMVPAAAQAQDEFSCRLGHSMDGIDVHVSPALGQALGCTPAEGSGSGTAPTADASPAPAHAAPDSRAAKRHRHVRARRHDRTHRRR